jgi:hypothetical protein
MGVHGSYVAEGDRKAVILEIDAGVVHVPEVGIDRQVAVGNQITKLPGGAVVRENFDTVEPALDVRSVEQIVRILLSAQTDI